ncbi:MAG: Calx-beta domain-containing protein [Sulfurimonas sp.]|uniref:Calx-beta domain-containing protein n=1 Tax=Sulfurimonas sp. TaxID=2022749 RepID=UPI00263978BD|nr:Calx-beta domain-containing protein [Sulfurimonas sp.]MDD5400777.1 Calx-beta domain-containing protein [Sulfurimonas sp.]
MKTLKFLVRLFAVFGLIMMFAVSGWGASNNPTVTFSPLSTSVTEGSGDVTITYTLSINVAPNQKDIVINYTTTNATAVSPTNFTATSGTITFTKNAAPVNKTFSVVVKSDAAISSDVLFSINLTDNTNSAQSVTLPNTTATVNILNITPPLAISIGNASIEEGNSGTTVISFPITLNTSLTSSTTIGYRFNDVTTDINDTNRTNGATYSFTLPSGTPAGMIAVPMVGIIGDTNFENNETFTITLLTTTSGSIDSAHATATGTIENDDASGGGGTPIVYSPGVVDVVDTYQSTVGTPFYQAVIKTKIASKTNMTLDAVYLGSDLTANAVYNAADMPVFLYVYYPATNTITRLYNQTVPTEPLAAVIAKGSMSGTSPLFTVPSVAKKEAYILMKYLDYQALIIAGGPNCLQNSSTGGNAVPGMPSCVSSDVQYLDAFHQEAFDRCKVQHGQPCEPSHHGYSGGGDPNFPGYDPIYDHKYGCYECTLGATPLVRSVDNFAIRPNDFNSTIVANQIFTAGTPASLTFRANRFGGTGTQDYNETEHTSFVVDVNISNPAKVCQDMNISFSPNINFTNGTVTNSYTLSNVGDFNVTMHEIVGSEFALVDADDTSVSLRLISPYTQQIKVIPDHFVIDGNLTNGSSGFTYLSNFEDHNTTQNRTISASLDLNVSARRADNNITSNYTSQCYAKNGNVTLGLTNPIVVTPTGALTKMIWYHSNPDNNGSVLLNGTTTQYPIPFLSTQFDSNDTNGTAQFNYKINFDRNVTKVANPFMVVVTDTNVTDVDAVNGTNSADSNATFLFGRTHASRQRFDVPTDAPYTANIYFESYCFESGCNKTLLPNGVNSTRTDDVRWFVNGMHITPTDGTAGTVTQKVGAGGTVSATAPTVANPSKTNLTYSGSKGYPYKTSMDNNASNWLIQNEYNPSATTNEFQVEFDRAGNWTGEHETNTTTKSVGGVKTNRRTMW